MSQLLESPSSSVTLPKPDRAPPAHPGRRRRRRQQPPQRHREQDAALEITRSAGVEEAAADQATDGDPTLEENNLEFPTGRPLLLAREKGISSRDRRRRLEALASRLAGTPAFTSRLAVYRRHTKAELSAAAALRPDLMPTLNGEFEHLSFFTP